MYKSIEQIRKLKAEKQAILSTVYQSCDPDDVYRKQKILGSMSIGISSDAANAIMPVLHEDGVGNIVWSNISIRLSNLSFISIPTASEIRERYKQSVSNPTVVTINGGQPEPGKKTKVKKIAIPSFLALLAAQGIAVPLLLSFIGGSKWALVKVIPCVINAAIMVIEVVKYFNIIPVKSKKTVFAPSKDAPNPSVNYEDMYRRAIEEVRLDNQEKLEKWFNSLEKITTEEIEKALRKAEA